MTVKKMLFKAVVGSNSYYLYIAAKTLLGAIAILDERFAKHHIDKIEFIAHVWVEEP